MKKPHTKIIAFLSDVTSIGEDSRFVHQGMKIRCIGNNSFVIQYQKSKISFVWYR